ncbi:MAG: HAD family hydrolase [Planctomycetes bacterium]|jgi:phosphoglycolate phosphatase|nr:HAD family hydrolase [Planctomycetota bacterium]
MRFKAVVFDLDGTLLDTIDDLADSMNVALAVHGLPKRTPAQCKYFVGDGVRNFALRAMAPVSDEKVLAKVIEKYTADYAQRWAAKTRPYEGVVELLRELGQRGLAMAVLSNKPDEFTRRMTQQMLPDCFAVVVGARPDVPHKPDPAAALAIARQLGAEPAQCLYVGDTNTDMQTAAAAGMYGVGVLWGFRTKAELIQNGAKSLVNHPLELLDLLD